MPAKKPTPLLGRLAIQLKMLTPREVERAVAESVSSGNPKLAQVFLKTGLLDRAQVARLLEVQKDLLERHRAKKQARATGAALPPVAPQAKPAPRAAEPADAPIFGGDAADSAAVHAVAAQAAEAAAPVRVRDVDELYAPPSDSTAARPLADPVPDEAPPTRPPPPAPPSSAAPSAGASASGPLAAPTTQAPPVSVTPMEDGPPSLELRVPDPGEADRSALEALLSAGVSAGASDIHLHAGGPLKQRLNGALEVCEESLDAEAVERLVSASLTPEQRGLLARNGEVDYCFDVDGIGRFRANAYRQQRGLDAVFRTVPAEPPTLAELGLPVELEKYTDYHQGMVLITGPAGCGKSATLAALVNHINERREEHILTIEDPIEIVHPSKRCLVNQRHAGVHTESFPRALRGALREDPDIIVIGELRDLETISLAMTAAETGHFVLATLHTSNAIRTVNRMIGAFPSNEQDQIRAMLSESLRAVVSQRLVPRMDGRGRVPALELLVVNRAIGNLIRDEKTVQIRSSMQTGKAHGMYLLEQSLNDLVAAGTISRDAALELAEEEKLITAGA